MDKTFRQKINEETRFQQHYKQTRPNRQIKLSIQQQ